MKRLKAARCGCGSAARRIESGARIRRFWGGLLLAGLAVLIAGYLPASASRLSGQLVESRPNIVVILTDDEPALDGRLMNFMPNAKSIFKDHGITFTDFHGESPLCCPGRAGYFTGQHTHNHGVITNSAKLFKPAMSIATQLHSVGYRTAMIGKYFNLYSKIAPSLPPGWDRFSAFGDAKYYSYNLWNDGNPVPEAHGTAPSDYSTDVLRQKAVDFIGSAPAAQPLFMWIAPNAPHGPKTPAPRYLSAPCSPPAWSPANYNEADVSDKPLYVQQTKPLGNTGQTFTTVCRVLLAVDDLIGAVRDSLAAAGRLENTIFIYAGDNGMNSGSHRLGGKSSPYVTEVPFYLAWPARLGTQPRAISERLQNIDLAPTLCSIAGCTLGPFPNGQTEPDGRSFDSLLLGTASSMGRDAVLDEMLVSFEIGNPPWEAVATTNLSPLGRWHYVEYADGEKELYDISNGPCWTWQVGQPGDPCELGNRVTDPSLASVVQALHTRLAQLVAEKGQGGGGGGGGTPANTPPACSNTTLTTTQDTPGDTAPVCSDANSDPLTYSIVAQGTKGIATVVAGMLHYVPNAGQTGADSFTYKANDGSADSNLASVAVTINPAGGGGSLTLVPNGDGSRDAVIKTQAGATTSLFAAIDEGIATADDATTYVRNDNHTSGSYFALLSDTPASFAGMATLTIDIRARTAGVVDDSTTLFAQIFKADEATPLSGEVAVAVNPGSAAWTTVSGVSLPGLVAGSKADWDGARLRLRWAHAPVGTADTTQLRLTAVELRGTYNTGP